MFRVDSRNTSVKQRVFFILLLACLGIPWPTRAALITGTLLDITGSLHPDKKIVFTPLDTPKDVQTGTVIWTPRQVTSVDGVWSATLGPGKYQLSIDGIVWRKICVPSGAGPYSLHAGDLNCGPISIWVGDTNMLHKPLSDGDDQTPGFLLDKITAGTNIVFVTTGTTNKTTSINAVVPDTDDHLLLVSSFDETPGLLADKILFGNGLSGSINGVEDDQLIIELENIGAEGTFGDATHFPVITVNDKGMVTSVTTNEVSGGPTVNTPGYLSYAVDADTLGDSPWYRISSSQLGFNGTGPMLTIVGTSIGLGTNAIPSVTGANNTAVGNLAGNAATSGTSNTLIGSKAGQLLTTGKQNTAVGVNAMSLGNVVNAISGNVAVGLNALANLTSGNGNVAVGDGALSQLSTNSSSIGIGRAAGSQLFGDHSVAIGTAALHGGLGSNVVAIGSSTFYSNLGNRSVGIGAFVAQFSTNITDGVLIGDSVAIASPLATLTNVIGIGSGAVVTNSNEIVIGNTSNTKAYLPPEVYAGGVLLGSGGGGTAGTVINTVASSGLLSVDSTKTNGIAATAAHVNSAINGGALTLGGMTFGVGSATLTNAEISGVSDPRTTNEVVLINSGGCNTLALKNMDDTGFSAITFRGKDNQEYGALGYGNTNTTGAPIFSDNVYWQIWGGTTSGAPKRGIITQDGNYGPTGSGFRFYQRQSFELNGDMTFWNLVAYPSQVAVFTVRGTNKTAVVGPIATPRVTLGTGDSQVITLGYAGSPGTYDNEIQGADANAAIVLREGPTPRNRNSYYTYGGTLANDDGHRFFTGGLRASQTVKLQIADDGVSVRGTLYANNIYSTNDISALTFTDRSDSPTNAAEAFAIVKSHTPKDGRVDHSKLHPKAWGKAETINNGMTFEIPDQSKRNLSMVVSAQALAIIDLSDRVEDLEKKVMALLAAIGVGAAGLGASRLRNKPENESSNAPDGNSVK